MKMTIGTRILAGYGVALLVFGIPLTVVVIFEIIKLVGKH